MKLTRDAPGAPAADASDLRARLHGWWYTCAEEEVASLITPFGWSSIGIAFFPLDGDGAFPVRVAKTTSEVRPVICARCGTPATYVDGSHVDLGKAGSARFVLEIGFLANGAITVTRTKDGRVLEALMIRAER